MLAKTVRVGHAPTFTSRGIPTMANVFCRIEYKNGRLSITGVVGPKANGDALGSCGQITDTLKSPELVPYRDFPVAKFVEVWERWHLNDIRAGCEHQRAEGWNKRPIDPTKPLNSYGKHYEGQRFASWNMLTWVPESEHPEGLLSRPCPTCGYKYGTKWLTEEVPEDVIAWLFSDAVPVTDVKPAWV